MNKKNLLVFDLDGLILDSLPNLQRCMMGAIEPFIGSKEDYLRFKEFDETSPGLSRYEKADFFSEELAKESKLSKKEIFEEILQQFNYKSLDARVKAELDRDIFKFTALSNQFDLVLLTNCDNSQLPIVLAHHEIISVFKDGFYGTPPKKRERLDEIIKTRKTDYSQIISISDSESDQDIAHDLGIDFVFIKRFAVDSGEWMLKSSSRFKSLGHLYSVLQKQNQ